MSDCGRVWVKFDADGEKWLMNMHKLELTKVRSLRSNPLLFLSTLSSFNPLIPLICFNPFSPLNLFNYVMTFTTLSPPLWPARRVQAKWQGQGRHLLYLILILILILVLVLVLVLLEQRSPSAIAQHDGEATRGWAELGRCGL